MDLKTPGLYIHIPFCISKCLYCDFYSLTSISAIPDFLDALFKEMEMYHNRFNPFDPSAAPSPALQSRDKGALRVNPEQASAFRPGSRRVDTVYIGGGTPSLLSPQQLESILISVRKNFDLIIR